MNPPIGHRKYLVTGASGYVGGRLVRALVDEKDDVRTLMIHRFFKPDNFANFCIMSAYDRTSGPPISNTLLTGVSNRAVALR